ncbi:phosphoribosyltransferase [Bacillus sp. OTU530]|uniref:phosphoribosyltransferase n=1 Tax=Bacillus sp. OTU530 TaxID=3043862 RepID=UPI00313CCC0E
MKKKSRYKEINTIIFNKLGSLFEEKGWVIDDEHNDSSLFSRFCELLSRLNVEQQEFIIDLTRRYQKVNFDDYTKLINELLNQMTEKLDYFKELKTLYVMPLVPEKDRNKIKSSTLVAYLFQSPQLKYNPNISGLDFKVRNELTPREVNRINESPKTRLLLVDDFIGTGETALNAFNFYKKMGIKSERIIIASLVSLFSGYNLIRENDIEIFSSKINKRALSDYYNAKELAEKLNIMQSIEEIVGPHDDYKFGYKGSEALITLARTPNNTFPVYWLEKAKGSRVPFPRGGN